MITDNDELRAQYQRMLNELDTPRELTAAERRAIINASEKSVTVLPDPRDSRIASLESQRAFAQDLAEKEYKALEADRDALRRRCEELERG